MIGILGGTGFFGSNLLVHLNERGLACKAFARHAPPPPCHARLRRALAETQVVTGDLADSGAVGAFLDGCEAVVFVVSHLLPSSTPEEIDRCLTWFPAAFQRLLGHCATAGVRHFLFVSSGGTVYGDDERRVAFTEDHPLKPRSGYGALCALLEGLVTSAHLQRGLPCTIVRVGNLYGPYKRPSDRQGLIENITFRAINGEPIRIFGDGSEVRDYVYVEEAAERIGEVLSRPATDQVFNLGTGHGTSTEDAVELVLRALDLPRPPVTLERERPCDVAHVVLDSSRFAAQFGRACEIPLAEGLQRYRAHLVETGILRDPWTKA